MVDLRCGDTLDASRASVRWAPMAHHSRLPSHATAFRGESYILAPWLQVHPNVREATKGGILGFSAVLNLGSKRFCSQAVERTNPECEKSILSALAPVHGAGRMASEFANLRGRSRGTATVHALSRPRRLRPNRESCT